MAKEIPVGKVAGTIAPVPSATLTVIVGDAQEFAFDVVDDEPVEPTLIEIAFIAVFGSKGTQPAALKSEPSQPFSDAAAFAGAFTDTRPPKISPNTAIAEIRNLEVLALCTLFALF